MLDIIFLREGGISSIFGSVIMGLGGASHIVVLIFFAAVP
jgi:hypothetical protein